MSTWTNSAGSVILALLLSATAAPAEVKVTPPPGYCVSPGGTEAGVVLMGSCAGMNGRPSGRRVPAAILTATIGPEGSAVPVDGAALQAFFGSTAGRAALSRDGRAATVQVLETAVVADAGRGLAFILRVRDSAPFPGGRATEEYWRALLPLGDRMVTLTVLGLAAQPMEPAAGLALLRDFIASMRRANRGS